MLHILEVYNFGIKLSCITDAKEYFLLEYESKHVSKQNSYKEVARATQKAARKFDTKKPEEACLIAVEEYIINSNNNDKRSMITLQ